MGTINEIKYVAWNIRGLSSGLPYLKQLMKTADIVAVSEHGLYNCELWKLDQVDSNFHVTAKACKVLSDRECNKKVGHSGAALFWRKTLSQFVKPVLDIQSDRICAIEIMIPHTRRLMLISVYLPHRASTIADYATELLVLESW
jgi:exonuclease III